ncbi:MAG: C4-dicarboxylate transporter DcuC [Cryomorphaceae bacterium]|nr:C4-dicarboxylate transporter DcuC [Flavobacteriales bacterium]
MLGPLLSVVFIVIVARLLLKKVYPHAVLLIAGLLMLSLAAILGIGFPVLENSTGTVATDLFKLIVLSFADTNAGVGLMIMSIGGFVAYSDKIGASNALVKLAMKPLSLLRNYPHVTASAVIPIGQVLFVCIPSAAGLGLLLMASVFPILVNLGVSRLSAASVITATTAFGIGPASALTASAAAITEEAQISYFIIRQIPLVIPLSIIVAVSYYFVNRYFDRKSDKKPVKPEQKSDVVKAPAVYALIPVFPLILLLLFSEVFQAFPTPIVLDTTTAMFISLFVAMVFEAVRIRNVLTVMLSLKSFFGGMGDIFKTVVTLIIAADIFSQGLISLGFIDGLLATATSAGLGAVGIGVVMTSFIFLASMLMGSGNASFFAFGPLIPSIAARLGVQSASMILPMNLAASMGRTVSPVSGVLIAVSEIAGVSTIAIVKRNIIPLGLALVAMLLMHFI